MKTVKHKYSIRPWAQIAIWVEWLWIFLGGGVNIDYLANSNDMYQLIY